LAIYYIYEIKIPHNAAHARGEGVETHGRSAGLTARELTLMETAFEHGELELALRL
jgi:hypothetical protein